MRRETAEAIIQGTKEIDRVLGQLYEVADQIDDEQEGKKFRRAFMTLVHETHMAITLEVVKQFPDLHPDKGRM
jgi:hypothetical protein